jgi:hypothetical protein
MNKITFGNCVYYLLDDVLSKYPTIFPQNIPNRKLVEKFNISTNDYTYAYIKKDEWILSNNKYSKAKILITESWFNDNYNIKINNMGENKLIEVPNMIINDKLFDIEIKAENIISIDTLLFRVRDIANVFDVPRIKDIIINKNTLYEENTDYKKIAISTDKSLLYLTYHGFLRFLFVTRGSKIAIDVQKWVIDIIYKVQFGNQQEKLSLMKHITSDYSSIVSDIFSNFDFSCVYLLGIGDFKQHTNVYKFGRTNNFNRRYKEHNKTYNTICKVCILQYIDEDYLPKVELEIKKYMDDLNVIISLDDHNELVSLSDKQVKSVINMYKQLSRTFSVDTDKLQKEVNDLKHQIEILSRDNIISLKNHEIEILKKSNQILELKNEIECNKK